MIGTVLLLAMMQVTPTDSMTIGTIRWPVSDVVFAPAFSADMSPLALMLRDIQQERDSVSAVRDSIQAMREERADVAGAAVGESMRSVWAWRILKLAAVVYGIYEVSKALKGPYVVHNDGDTTIIQRVEIEESDDGGYHGRKGKGRGHDPGG